MIAPANPNDESPDSARGKGGDSYLKPAQQNILVGMMFNPRRRWRLNKAAKRQAIAITLANLDDEDGRVRNSAVANLLKMEAQNQGDQHKSMDKNMPDKHEHSGTIDHRHGLSTLLSEAEYVGYLRNRTSHEDSDAGLICQVREPGNGKPMENGSAHGDPGQGTNGHRNGSK